MDRGMRILVFVDQLHSIRLAYLYNVSYLITSQYNIVPRVQNKSISGPTVLVLYRDPDGGTSVSRQ